MVLAELITGSGILDPEKARYDSVTEGLPQRIEGLALSPGMTVGTAVVQRQRVTVERMFSDDPVLEGQRVRGALAAMHGQLDEVLERPEFSGTSEHRDVLETFRMFAEDRGWLRRIDEAVQSGLSAEAAVQRVQEETRVRMGRVTEPYLRERLLDFEELTNRLLRQLVDGGQTDGMVMPADAVLVARTLGPA